MFNDLQQNRESFGEVYCCFKDYLFLSQISLKLGYRGEKSAALRRTVENLELDSSESDLAFISLILLLLLLLIFKKWHRVCLCFSRGSFKYGESGVISALMSAPWTMRALAVLLRGVKREFWVISVDFRWIMTIITLFSASG